MQRSWFVALVILAQIGCFHVQQQQPLARAYQYLWSKQASDGGWHSNTYGLLRSGQSLTPFVLEALLQANRPQPAKEDAAIAFIKHNMQPDGSVGMQDLSIPDYPNYATALAIRALSRAMRPNWKRDIQPMVEYLRRQQLTEQNGWRRADPAYGAWGMGGDLRKPPNTGHVDLSMTRHVLEALRAADVPLSDPAFARAQVFVERCQNPDGGFFFTTTEFDTNKAGRYDEHFRSYGTTTADGILALLAIGEPPSSRHVVAARRWLTTHHNGMEVPGFVGPAYQRWPRGLSFYYASASTAAFRALDVETESITGTLERTQRGDGSWSNPENLVKEDDPLIATAFALRALVANRRASP